MPRKRKLQDDDLDLPDSENGKGLKQQKAKKLSLPGFVQAVERGLASHEVDVEDVAQVVQKLTELTEKDYPYNNATSDTSDSEQDEDGLEGATSGLETAAPDKQNKRQRRNQQGQFSCKGKATRTAQQKQRRTVNAQRHAVVNKAVDLWRKQPDVCLLFCLFDEHGKLWGQPVISRRLSAVLNEQNFLQQVNSLAKEHPKMSTAFFSLVSELLRNNKEASASTGMTAEQLIDSIRNQEERRGVVSTLYRYCKNTTWWTRGTAPAFWDDDIPFKQPCLMNENTCKQVMHMLLRVAAAGKHGFNLCDLENGMMQNPNQLRLETRDAIISAIQTFPQYKTQALERKASSKAMEKEGTADEPQGSPDPAAMAGGHTTDNGGPADIATAINGAATVIASAAGVAPIAATVAATAAAVAASATAADAVNGITAGLPMPAGAAANSTAAATHSAGINNTGLPAAAISATTIAAVAAAHATNGAPAKIATADTAPGPSAGTAVLAPVRLNARRPNLPAFKRNKSDCPPKKFVSDLAQTIGRQMCLTPADGNCGAHSIKQSLADFDIAERPSWYDPTQDVSMLLRQKLADVLECDAPNGAAREVHFAFDALKGLSFDSSSPRLGGILRRIQQENPGMAPRSVYATALRLRPALSSGQGCGIWTSDLMLRLWAIMLRKTILVLGAKTGSKNQWTPDIRLHHPEITQQALSHSPDDDESVRLVDSVWAYRQAANGQPAAYMPQAAFDANTIVITIHGGEDSDGLGLGHYQATSVQMSGCISVSAALAKARNQCPLAVI